jgi:limonene-1,2-epoxide hydrolase
MATKLDTVKAYLAALADKDATKALDLLTDDIVMTNPMRGPVSGKDNLKPAIESPRFSPTFGEPAEAGEQIKATATLPPGMPISSITYTFSFAGEKINKIDVGM